MGQTWYIASLPTYVSVTATTLLIIISVFVTRRLQISQARTEPKPYDLKSNAAGCSMLSERLAAALPESIIFPHDAAFERSMKSYWAQQECEGMFFRIAHLFCNSKFRVHVRGLRKSCYLLRDLAIGISDCKPSVDSIPCHYAPRRV